MGPSGIRNLVANQAGTVVTIRLCKHLYSVSGLSRVTRGCRLGVVRSYTRTRKTCFGGKEGTNTLNSATNFDFCPNGGLNTLNSKNTMAASGRRLTRGMHYLTGCNSSTGCVRPCVKVGDHLSRLRTTMLGIGLGELSESGGLHHTVTFGCLRKVGRGSVLLPRGAGRRARRICRVFAMFSSHHARLRRCLGRRNVRALVRCPVPPRHRKTLGRCNGLSLPVARHVRERRLDLPVSPLLASSRMGEIVTTMGDFGKWG